MLVLHPAPAAPRAVVLDADQRAVVEHAGPAVLVRGAAGTGRTTTALAVVAAAIAGGTPPERALLIAPTRRSAAALRDELSARVGRTSGQPVVRTAASAAFSVLRARAALRGEPAPTLISGPEQDGVLADLLAGHLEGEGAAVVWPATVPAGATRLRAFRDELRDLLMRAAERGLGPEELRRLGRRHRRPEWVAAAQVFAEYLAVTRLRTGTPDAGARFDPAVVVDEAAEALAAWEAEVPGAPRPRWDVVVVDDYQEATAATARLLHVLAGDGARLVLLADPDSAVQTFRGAAPGLVDRAGAPAGVELGAFSADELVLRTVHRHGDVLRGAVAAVTAEIRGPGRAGRAARAASPGGDARVALLRSPAQEAAYVAWVLRSAHLDDGVPWSGMAVVARSGAQVTDLRRALLASGVPVAVAGSDLPLRGEPAVRPLLRALTCVLQPGSLTAEAVAELLTSPLGGLDSVGLRRLRRALRSAELAEGGGRTSDALLLEAVDEPARAGGLPLPVRRPLERVSALLAAGRAVLASPAATVSDVLWALWSAAGVAEVWRRAALAGGTAGARADRDLDAVLALFSAAEQFVERMPQASVPAFLEHLRTQDLPADTLAARAGGADAVAVVTAASAAGREWDVVVVAGVQEGTWPDLRLRDSVLGAQHLVEVLSGRALPVGADASGHQTADAAAQARGAVLDDELRAFAVAVSRARRRVVVTAVTDTDHRPSAFVDLVEPPPDDVDPAGADDVRVVAVPPALDLRSVVAQCRAELEAAVAPGPDHPAAALLARLAAEGVPGADPRQWYGAPELSTADPLWADDDVVPLSPSRIESAARCSLRWALEAAGGTAADTNEQSLGTLVHELAATMPDASAEELRAALDERWAELGLGDGWVGAARRRRADAMLGRLAAYLRSAGPLVATEAPFDVEVGRVRLRGSVDRLERADDAAGEPRLRVVDLKTGRTAVSKADAGRHAQLGAYQAAVDAGAFEHLLPGARPGGASLVYVGTDAKGPTERDQAPVGADGGWVADLLEEVAATVSRPAMTATVGDLCRVCPVRRSCPAQPEGRVVGG